MKVKAFDYQPQFKKTVLPNGTRVVTEHHPYSRAVSAGIYIDLGSRDESPELNGAAHFIEHLVFKGTRNRNSYEIVKELEAVGGEINAYTSREYTCFHASSLRENLDVTMDVLSDLVSNALFDPEDFEKERQVILQEILMSADDLEEFIFDLYFELVHPGNSLSQPILGTKESLMGITRDQLYDFYVSRYLAEHLVVSVAGAVDHDEVVEWVNKNLLKKSGKKIPDDRKPPVITPVKKFYQKSSEQVHFLMGLPSVSYNSSQRFDSYIINAFLGGGMTSQLYQKIREDKGLAYSVYSYLQSFTDSGLMMFYAGTSEDKIPAVAEIIRSELNSLVKNGIGEESLRFYKRQVTGQIILGADDVENRMNSLAVNEMVFGEYRPVDHVLNEIEKITPDSIQSFLGDNFDFNKLGGILLGPCAEKTQSEVFSFLAP